MPVLFEYVNQFCVQNYKKNRTYANFSVSFPYLLHFVEILQKFLMQSYARFYNKFVVKNCKMNDKMLVFKNYIHSINRNFVPFM